MSDKTRILATGAVLVALGTVASHFIWFPTGVAKAYPVQHAINVIAGVALGPGPAVLIALAVGLLRNLLGVGTLLAFPGGMIGALLAGLTYRILRRRYWAALGEVLGTGLLGALLSFPVARLIMGHEVGALFYVVPFTISSLAGALAALIVMKALPLDRLVGIEGGEDR